jgi:DNA-binding CsgD family transcriptional regulator
MGRSGQLSVQDIREVFRILQESVELGHEPATWRSHMLERMCKLIHAQGGLSFVIPTHFDPKNLKPPVFVFTPLPRERQAIFNKYFRTPNVAGDPLTPAIQKLSHRPVTRLRRQLVDDKTWYNSDHYKTMRVPMGIDDMIHAHDPLPQFGVSAILDFTRNTGEKPFQPRDAKIVDLLRSELRLRWLTAAEKPQPKLTPRLSQILTHLLGSKSEKQIADYLGLSPHTAHNHIKALYRRMHVSSRSELHRAATTPIVLPKIGYGDI